MSKYRWYECDTWPRMILIEIRLSQYNVSRSSKGVAFISGSSSTILKSTRSNIVIFQTISRSYRRHDYWTNVINFGTAHYHGDDRVYRPRIINYLFITTRLTHLRIFLSINLMLSTNIVIWKLFWIISGYFLYISCVS